jgi:hypothetical protein
MNIAELAVGEMIMRYKSTCALEHDSREIDAWFNDEYAKTKRIDDLAKAIIDGDNDILAKAANSDLEMAKADVARMKKAYGESEASASLYMASTERLAALMREYAKRTEAHKDAKRRSHRFNEAWNSAPPGGEWLRPTIH